MKHIPRRFSFWLWGLAVLLVGSATGQATILTTTDPGEIAAFQSGAAVQTFDNLPGQTITSYTPLLSATSTIFNDPAQPYVSYDGTTGTPIGIFSPSGPIAGDTFSGNNVAAALSEHSNHAFGGDAYVNVNFASPVCKVGVYVPWLDPGQTFVMYVYSASAILDHIRVSTAGQFVYTTRNTTEISRVRFYTRGGGGGRFTFDDLTYGPASASGGIDCVPETGSALNLAAAGLFLVLAQGAFKGRHS